ncbi:hypothetical protein C8J57DRAFT_1507812 [Mycena rebaudengoi]|nr:hypothetical protein C8J57DRAFT_1507812 [Mycena rebaudengoi]
MSDSASISAVVPSASRPLGFRALDPSRPLLPAEMLLHVLSFVEECDPLVTIAEFVRWRGDLRRVFSNFIEAVPGLFSRLIVTPSSSYELTEYHLNLGGSRPLHILLSIPSNNIYIPAHHRHLSMVQNFRQVVGLVAVYMPMCVHLTIQSDSIAMLEVALRALSVGTPDLLDSMEVVLDPPHFGVFYPPCLLDFAFFLEDDSAAPFLPFTRLVVRHDSVPRPRFVHLSCEGNSSSVILPHDWSISWPDILRVLTASVRLRVLVLRAVEFIMVPEWFMNAPALHITTLDLEFGGVRSMGTLLAHIPFPELLTLKVRFAVADDIACLAQCGAILGNVTELVLLGSLPHAHTAAVLFRFAFRVEILDLRLGPQFFESFQLASSSSGVDGQINYNACPALRQLRLSGITLQEVRLLLQDRAQVDYEQVHTVLAENPPGEVGSELINWFTTHLVELSGFVLPS